jgi:murein DD-endopeptidase MepM/ murein hydrolase activator NlpD
MASRGSFGKSSHDPGFARDPYALPGGRRHMRVRPGVFWTVTVLMAILVVWSGSTAAYFAFRDDVLKRLIARHADMQYAYEDRIAELRAQVDRLSSRQLLDQEQVDGKLDTLAKRQAALEARASLLAQITADPNATGTVRASPAATRPAQAGASSGAPTVIAPPVIGAKPSPISDTVPAFAPTREPREGRADILPLPDSRTEQRTTAQILDRLTGGTAPTREVKVVRLAESLDRVELQQANALNAIHVAVDARARRLRGVLTDLGMDQAKLPALRDSAVGGPFVPVAAGTRLPPFERQVHAIRAARETLDQLTRTLVFVPVRRPISEEHEQTSGFGIRSDPFFGRPAMHTGLDFRAPVGEPIRATAAGKVIQSGWAGGYGKMVEIDHGNGFTTRYAHLSDIDVEEGQDVRAGQVIGNAGSTGRSTGPHLHYETRIDGEPVNPERFLRAGVRLEELF